MKIYRFSPICSAEFFSSDTLLATVTGPRYSVGEHQHWRQLLFVEYSWSRGDTLLISAQEVYFAQIPCSGTEGWGQTSSAVAWTWHKIRVNESNVHIEVFFSPLTLILKSAHLPQSLFLQAPKIDNDFFSGSRSPPLTSLAGDILTLGQHASWD